MRPVLLEIAGFGSFREPTTVDFAGADYFALVGPTGAGKSTVIDAMTFALFGSVPRWDDRRTVALALAPTANHGTVRLVFDVGAERYVIARELRRSAAGTVTVKGVRLERLADPTTFGTIDDDVEPIAADSKATRAVEELLGLTFEHFCTCVVLPQGDFAEFLHAKPADRQKILVKLLGLEVYEQIGKAANAEATRAGQEADLVAEQLLRYLDATAETATAAADRVTVLTELEAWVADALTGLADAHAAAEAARALVARLTEERDQLAAVRVPAELGDLDERLRATRAAATDAATAVTVAEEADSAARDAVAAAPERGPLEQARRDRLALDDLVAGRSALVTAYETATAYLADAERAVEQADGDAERARAERDRHAAAAEAARATVTRLTAERDRLVAVRPPPGLTELDGRLRVAADAAERAAAGLGTAEEADSAARGALAAAPERGPLEQARRDRVELDRLTTARPGLAAAREDAAAVLAAAERAVADAEEALAHAREAVESAGRGRTVAALRPHLVAGAPCPVCEQTVATLPAPLPDAPADTALAGAVTAAAAAVEARRRDWSAATRAAQQAEGQLAAADGRAATFAADLADLGTLERALADRTEREEAAAAADARLITARAARVAADRDLAKIDAEAAGFRTALRETRDGLAALGATAGPPAGEDVATGWATLTAWARTAAAERTTALAEAERTAGTAADLLAEAESNATATAAELLARRRAHTEAARAEQRTAGDLAAADRSATALTDRLADAPDAAALERELAHLDTLDRAAQEADRRLRTARTASASAQRTAAEAHEAVASTVRDLTAVRDGLVRLGAPTIPADDPVGGWRAFADWAAEGVVRRENELPAATGAVSAADATAGEARQRLAHAFAEAEVEVAEGRPLAQAAGSAVAAALAAARAAEQRIAERRQEAADLSERQAAAETTHQVARQLGQLLRSNAFPQWLVASALDLLVAEASATLTELSGGQFALTHESGEFVIVDHADADSRRPVKTLSGGETFQASLALALALSAHLSTMAVSGAARLDAIFLDEGFGTLDEATLEVVAATLENLAAGGERMVGLVTHVAGLAERVPVRFEVTRDQRTSSVTKVVL